MSPLPIGIDLGTTHSVVAVFDEAPRVLVEEGEALVPSVVALDDAGHVLVGRAAAERLARGLPDTASRFKSDMGTDRTELFDGQRRTPTFFSAVVLRELRQRTTALVGEVGPVVITVPAWFREPQRRATVEAAHLAGWSVARLINEPTAAALHYDQHTDDEPRTVAVVDLGGGTFDVTLLELFDGIVDVRGSLGDVHLGGEDVTDLLARHLSTAIAVPRIDRQGQAWLRARAERAKRQLSDVGSVDVEGVVVTRATLEALCHDLRGRLQSCLKRVLMQASTRPEAVDEVLLVGGATRMPWVAEAALEVFGRRPRASAEVDHAVALGAAIQAGMVARHEALRERLVTDVLTHTLGVAVVRELDGVYLPDRLDPILGRGTALPCSRRQHYRTMHPEQDSVTIRVFEGEHRDASRNQELASVTIDELPPTESHHELEVRFTHDTSGLLEIEASIEALGREARCVVQRGGLTYTEQEQTEQLRSLANLKTHPRELLPNRWLLERANRVLPWLSGHDRATVDRLLDFFEAALEREEQERIDELRPVLQQHLEKLVKAHALELE